MMISLLFFVVAASGQEGGGYMALPASRRWIAVDEAVGMGTQRRQPELFSSDLAWCGRNGYNYGPWPVSSVAEVGSEILVEVCVPKDEGTHSFLFCDDPKLWGGKQISEISRISLEKKCFKEGQDRPAQTDKSHCGDLVSVTKYVKVPDAPGRTVMSWHYTDYKAGKDFYACADIDIYSYTFNSTLRGTHKNRLRPVKQNAPRNSHGLLILVLASIVLSLAAYISYTKSQKQKCDHQTQMSPINTKKSLEQPLYHFPSSPSSPVRRRQSTIEEEEEGGGGGSQDYY